MNFAKFEASRGNCENVEIGAGLRKGGQSIQQPNSCTVILRSGRILKPCIVRQAMLMRAIIVSGIQLNLVAQSNTTINGEGRSLLMTSKIASTV